MRGKLWMPGTAMVFFGVACSNGPSEPRESGPDLEILAGAGLSDTISAMPGQGLTVRVRGESGRPEQDVDVRL